MSLIVQRRDTESEKDEQNQRLSFHFSCHPTELVGQLLATRSGSQNGQAVNPTLVKMLAKVAPITDRRLKMAGD